MVTAIMRTSVANWLGSVCVCVVTRQTRDDAAVFVFAKALKRLHNNLSKIVKLWTCVWIKIHTRVERTNDKKRVHRYHKHTHTRDRETIPRYQLCKWEKLHYTNTALPKKRRLRQRQRWRKENDQHIFLDSLKKLHILYIIVWGALISVSFKSRKKLFGMAFQPK